MRELVDYAKSFLGIPYVWGGNNPFTGWDCSGFVQWVLKAADVDPKGDQTAQALRDHFVQSSAGIPHDQPSAGCLIFYGKGRENISHVAFCMDSRWVIEAGGGDHKHTGEEYIKSGACTRLRLYDYRQDIVSIIKPKYRRIS